MELSIIDKKLAMDSRDIAKLTKKKHNIVMRDIREMLEKIGTDLYTSFERTYLDKYGREQKCYYLPHRELLILLTGYSVELRTAVIDRWAALERHYQEERKKSIEVRHNFTDELKDRGYTNPYEYINTTQGMKKTLGIFHKKAEVNTKELKAIRASEAMASLLLDDEYGYKEVNPVCIEASGIVTNVMQKRLSCAK
ncbi:MAG: Rha family transcriptional regulator [Methanobrevibacter sp.]|nr:Rha family transcriptional regulator [Clostridia bacterium]MBR3197119.1 Rha family transcriptional regulator [Methanobrevibacter sp.]